MKISEFEPVTPARVTRRRTPIGDEANTLVKHVEEVEETHDRFGRAVQVSVRRDRRDPDGKRKNQRAAEPSGTVDGDTAIDETGARSLAARARRTIGDVVLEMFTRRASQTPPEHVA